MLTRGFRYLALDLGDLWIGAFETGHRRVRQGSELWILGVGLRKEGCQETSLTIGIVVVI